MESDVRGMPVEVADMGEWTFMGSEWWADFEEGAAAECLTVAKRCPPGWMREGWLDRAAAALSRANLVLAAAGCGYV